MSASRRRDASKIFFVEQDKKKVIKNKGRHAVVARVGVRAVLGDDALHTLIYETKHCTCCARVSPAVLKELKAAYSSSSRPHTL